MRPKFSRMLSTHLHDTCALCLCSTSLSDVSQRFLGNLCTTSWTRSWYQTNAYRRALFSSTPWSGRDRCGASFMVSQHNKLYYPPWKVMVDSKACFSCVVLQFVAELLHEQAQPIVSTCSVADVQAAFNTIVTRIQRLWVPAFKISILVDCQRIPGNVHPNFESVICFFSLPQFSSILGSIHLPEPSNFC